MPPKGISRNTESKEEIKKEEKVARSVTSQTELKNVQMVNEIIEQKKDVSTPGSRPSTYTKTQLRNGTIKETYGEMYNDRRINS